MKAGSLNYRDQINLMRMINKVNLTDINRIEITIIRNIYSLNSIKIEDKSRNE